MAGWAFCPESLPRWFMVHSNYTVLAGLVIGIGGEQMEMGFTNVIFERCHSMLG